MTSDLKLRPFAMPHAPISRNHATPMQLAGVYLAMPCCYACRHPSLKAVLVLCWILVCCLLFVCLFVDMCCLHLPVHEFAFQAVVPDIKLHSRPSSETTVVQKRLKEIVNSFQEQYWMSSCTCARFGSGPMESSKQVFLFGAPSLLNDHDNERSKHPHLIMLQELHFRTPAEVLPPEVEGCTSRGCF